MQDMTGAPVEVGDLLIDERGHIFRARPTAPLSQQDGIIYTNDITFTRGKVIDRDSGGFLRKRFCLKVSLDNLVNTTPKERKELYDKFWQIHSAPLIRADIEGHRAATNVRRQERGIVM